MFWPSLLFLHLLLQVSNFKLPFLAKIRGGSGSSKFCALDTNDKLTLDLHEKLIKLEFENEEPTGTPQVSFRCPTSWMLTFSRWGSTKCSSKGGGIIGELEPTGQTVICRWFAAGLLLPPVLATTTDYPLPTTIMMICYYYYCYYCYYCYCYYCYHCYHCYYCY